MNIVLGRRYIELHLHRVISSNQHRVDIVLHSRMDHEESLADTRRLILNHFKRQEKTFEKHLLALSIEEFSSLYS